MGSVIIHQGAQIAKEISLAINRVNYGFNRISQIKLDRSMIYLGYGFDCLSIIF